MPLIKPVPTGITATEPALSVGTITAAVTAVIGLLVAFGIDLTQDQQVAILGMAAVIAPAIVAIITRAKVYSPASTQKISNDSALTGDATIPKPPAK